MARSVPLGLAAAMMAAWSCTCSPTVTPTDGGQMMVVDGGPSCSSGQTACSGICRDLQRDGTNCGVCGKTCGATSSCEAGKCVPICDTGKMACQEACFDLLNDAAHCGTCSRQCKSDESCRMGECTCTATNSLSCGGSCVDVTRTVAHCGGCDSPCDAGQTCSASACLVVCPAGQARCGAAPGECHNVLTDDTACGNCNTACGPDEHCQAGRCECTGNLTRCGGACVATISDPANCGACGNVCGNGSPCFQGVCLPACGINEQRCGAICFNTTNDSANCATCGNQCPGATTCTGSSCVSCNSATTDCDGDGWLQSEGDCCDNASQCPNPKMVNPGAFEIAGNGVDDNCNGLTDTADTIDTMPCDSSLPSNSTAALDYARAIDICRTTTENPATPQQRTWGLISADLLRADGSPLTFADAVSIRSSFGTQLSPMSGSSMAVISTGLASDGTQTNPGPNGGPVGDPDSEHSDGGVIDEVNIQNCSNPLCIKDWFGASRPPLKQAFDLPSAPSCSINGSSSAPEMANDSVMLRLRLRAPTNAYAFQLKAVFFSSEYPEYVCSPFNDQLVALVDTPSGTPVVPNPVDKNLMTYSKAGLAYPVGINVAAGTDLFARCVPKAMDPCWETAVAAQSCSLGAASLNGTGFEAPPGPSECTTGGGTRWLSTTGNVVPGQIVELRIAIWDVDDWALDSLALLDGFRWLTSPGSPGTD